MYRIIGFKRLSNYNFNILTSTRNENILCELKAHRGFSGITNNNCGNFLSKYDNVYKSSLTTNSHKYSRNLSTQSERLLLLMKNKKKQGKTKKYTELLQVTEQSTKQVKASIEKLKYRKLAEFINETKAPIFSTKTSKSPFHYKKYNLEKLETANLHDNVFEEKPILFVGNKFDVTKITPGSETLKEILHSCNTFREMNVNDEMSGETVDIDAIGIGSIQSLSPLALEDPQFLEEHEFEDEIAESLNVDVAKAAKNQTNSNQKSIQNTKYKSKFHSNEEDERLAKRASLSQNLLAFIELSVNCGMQNRALVALQNYRYQAKKGNPNVLLNDIKIYNTLIQGFASSGNINKIKEILAIIKDEKVSPSPQTFAGVFECLGRQSDSPDNKKLIEKYYAYANEQNITLNDIMDKSQFVFDQREIVMDTLHKIDPNFVPSYTPPILTYSNVLCSKLNEDILPIDMEPNGCRSQVDHKMMNSKMGFSFDEMTKMCEEQMKTEINNAVIVESIEKFAPTNDVVLDFRKKLAECNKQWRSEICHAFHRDFKVLGHHTHSKSSRSINLLPYLKVLNVQHVADILLQEVRTLAQGSEMYSPSIGLLYKDLGQKAQIRYQIELKKRNGVLEKTTEIYNEYCKVLEKCNSTDNSRQLWQRILHRTRPEGASADAFENSWPLGAMVGVGRFLYNILLRDIKIDVNILRQNNKTPNLMPAFYTLYRNHGRHIKEELKPHPVLSKLFRGSQQQTIVFNANMLPMVCPPKPWSTPIHGGYLVIKSDIIRLPGHAFQQWARINETPIQNLYPSLDSLNQLASIPWKVNTQLLDVMLEIFKNGGDPSLNVPPHPSTLPPIKMTDDKTTLTKQQKFDYMRQKLLNRRKQIDMYSLWCDALYRLSLANHFRKKVFWLPHNMDFRGRVYPLPPHLNHLGSDLARSLLVFHQQQPLGPDGFKWLKLHCINLTGLKKQESTIERLLYAEEVMDDIVDSAENPLTGRMWWSKSDEPWQTLGCCMEIAKVLKCDNPEEFMSSLPIHQDGSCNGLQHYAALGRDTAGAISVNLAPSKKPQDVYSAVASLVEENRKVDADNGIEVAKVLAGFVRRKVVKQTIMTTVYGVTRYGARLQIGRQLKDISNFPKEWVWPASFYLTKTTFNSLREMFKSTKEIQDWFTECAQFIASVGSKNVEWVTPLGLPVVQPYNRYEKITSVKFKTMRGNEQLSMDQYEKPNVLKQRNAFPPNFIHSLDSSHMMMTSLHCEKAGLTFVSVHDCFWTHACNVAEMNKICREQFVALHSQPILEDLSNFLLLKYGFNADGSNHDGLEIKNALQTKLNMVLANVPQKGDFDLNNVLKSVYFFS